MLMRGILRRLQLSTELPRLLSKHPVIMSAPVKRALPAGSELQGKRSLNFTVTERPDDAGAMFTVVRIGRADPQLLHFCSTDLPAALHELPAVQSGALLKARRKIPVDEPIQSVFEELIIHSADSLVERFGDSGKGIDQRRIEVAAAAFHQDPHGRLQGKRFLVGTPGGQGVEDIGHGEDSGVDWNIVPLETGFITTAVT